MELRRPNTDELRLLEALAKLARMEGAEAWLLSLMVRDMPDGGMGSLELQAQPPKVRRAIVCLAAVQFTESDGVEVIASLYANEDCVPVELDMWKTDFGELKKIPLELRPLASGE